MHPVPVIVSIIHFSMSSGNDVIYEHALLSLVRQNVAGGFGGWLSDRRGWNADSGVPVCEWEGVTCGGGDGNEDGAGDGPRAIVELRLPNVGLSGTIPPELGLLRDLEILSLSGNMLRGSIPRELADLEKLVTLDLTGCFLTGTLPQTFGSTYLVSLLLADNAISGRFFQDGDSPHLRSIQEIRMENNLLTGTIHGPTLSKMTELHSLSLSDNDLSGLIPGEELGSMPSLRYLYLDSNSLVGPLPSHLATQPGGADLLELWVQDNALSGTVPASYARFDKMHDFYVDGNKLTGEVPEDLCGPGINADFFADAPAEGTERNYCDSVACPAGSAAFEGVFPCTRCPGGEVARIKNRYLGHTGNCTDVSERDVLAAFRSATTKGGPWTGTDDWGDETKPVCEMTGITCDARGRVTGIYLKNRGLEGHIPDEVGSLAFLEGMDVSDNRLMGHLPSDLRWTSVTRLDVSGNRMRGLIPPLLCLVEELNGNGRDGAFYCDRIACPAGTYNSLGRHTDVDGGEACRPCYDGTPFIGQKVCDAPHMPFTAIDWRKEVQAVERATEEMGTLAWFVLVVGFAALLASVLLCFAVRRNKKFWRSKYEAWAGKECDSTIVSSRPRKEEKTYEHDDEDKEEDRGDRDDEHSYARRSHHKGTGYREFTIAKEYNTDAENCRDERGEERNFSARYDDYKDDDYNFSPATAHGPRNATELISHHQEISHNRQEKIGRVV